MKNITLLLFIYFLVTISYLLSGCGPKPPEIDSGRSKYPTDEQSIADCNNFTEVPVTGDRMKKECKALRARPIKGQFIVKVTKEALEEFDNLDALKAKITQVLLSWNQDSSLFSAKSLNTASKRVCPSGLILYGLDHVPLDFEDRVAKASTRADENTGDEIEGIGMNIQFYIKPLGPSGPFFNAEGGGNTTFTPPIDTCDSSIVVAIVDSGVDYNHPYLRNHIRENSGETYPANQQDDDNNGLVDDWIGYDYALDSPLPYDQQGHGTHLNGIIADDNLLQILRNSCVRLDLMNLKISNNCGITSLFDASCAIGYAIEDAADIINLSWGFYADTTETLVTGILEKVLREAEEKNILVVTSAGNDDLDTDKCPHWPSNFSFSNLISVAALEELNSTSAKKIADYSNYGVKSVDFAIPGTNIESTIPISDQASLSGTSMSAAYLTRLAVQIMANGTQTPVDIIQALKNNGNTLITPAKPVSTGLWLE